MTLEEKLDIIYSQSLENEVWKPIEKTETYFASTEGRIYSFKQNKKVGKFLNPKRKTANGYYQVYINKQTKSVHRIIAETFLGIEPTKVVNHINEIKTDNRLINLEYLTDEENLNYGMARLRACKGVIQMDKDGNEIARYNSQVEAAKAVGVVASCINQVINGKGKTAGGYYWKYIH